MIVTAATGFGCAALTIQHSSRTLHLKDSRDSKDQENPTFLCKLARLSDGKQLMRFVEYQTTNTNSVDGHLIILRQI